MNDLGARLDHDLVDVPFPDFSTAKKGNEYEMINRYKPHLSLKKDIKKVFEPNIFTYLKLTNKHAELSYKGSFDQLFKLKFYINAENNRLDMDYEFNYMDYKCFWYYCCYPFGLQENIAPCLKNMLYVYELINREVIHEFNLTIGLAVD